MTLALSIMLVLVSIWSIVQAYIIASYRSWWLQERKAAEEAIAAQKDLISGQEAMIKGLRGYMEVKEAMLIDSIERLVKSLRYWTPDETMVVPDKEGDEWYETVNAIFEAEKRVSEIKEAR